MRKFTKEEENHIKYLIKQKNYIEVFNRYGIEGFNRYLSTFQKIRFKNELIKRRNEDTLIELFDPKIAKKAITKIQDMEKFEKSKIKVIGAIKYAGHRALHGLPFEIATDMLIFSLSLTGLGIGLTRVSMSEDKAKYKVEIEEYQDTIKAYTDYLKTLNLDNEEIVIKLVTDMWENIKGYGEPELDPLGNEGIFMMSTDAVGVCRNFADDIANKLNLMNPNFNARVLPCYISGERLALMDSVRPNDKILSSNETVTDREDNQEEKEVNENVFKILANHAIVIFDMPGEKYPFVIDPTNPALGIVANGEIIMFNSTFINGERIENGATFEYRGLHDLLISNDAFKNLFGMLKAARISEETLKELNNKYGVERQDELVSKINEIDDQEYIQDNFYTR